MMNQLLKKAAFVLFLAAHMGVAYAQTTAQPGQLQREIRYLAEVLPGRYDNSEQLSFDASVGKTDMENGGHLRVHSQIRRVELPQFGEYVFYVEEYKHNDPTDIFRQRLYTLQVDAGENALRLTLHFFRDGKTYLGAHDDPALLDSLDVDGVMALEGCDVFIRRDTDWFAGAMKTKTCLFGDGDNRRYSDYQLRVSKQQYWFRDRILSAVTDEPLEEVADFSWHQLERARQFACMIDVPKEPGGRPNFTQHYITIHDQGGRFAFTHPDGRAMNLQMGHTWGVGMQRETFYIAVLDSDPSKPTIVYGWGEPGADRIGVNPGYLRIQCDLATDKVRELQRSLRSGS